MWLNLRGKGRDRGPNGNLNSHERCGKMTSQGTVFKPGTPSAFGPSSMCSGQVPFGGPSFFGLSSSFNFESSKPLYGKYPRKNFKRKFPPQKNEALVLEIDLTKPWITEELKANETKKLDLLSIWRISKNDEDWGKYKIQKLKVQSLYENAKAQYIASHPDEAALWNSMAYFKKLYCETCDKSFRTDDDLVRHELEHETCGRDGCSFTAHSKIISKHIKMQHDSGLYGRIGALYTKEDIAKWIEERKKRYPTRKLLEEKKAMEEEKLNRGERIKEDNSRFNKSFKNRKKGEVKKKFEKRTKNRNRRQRKKKKKFTPVKEQDVSSERRDVPAFHGIKDTDEREVIEEKTEEDNLNISDDEWETEIKHDILKPMLNNSLSLLATYNSDDENYTTECAQEEKKEDKYVSNDEGSSPEEVATVHRKSPALEDSKERKIFQKRKLLDKNIKQYKKIRNSFEERNSESRSLSLLEKLLKDEIKHERNVIFQCVHYVVKHNFFKV